MAAALTLTGQAAPGDLDTLNAQVVGSAVHAIAIQPDGKTVIGGTFTSVLGQTRTNLARLNADGTLDTAFVAAVNGTVNAVAVQSDGKILVAGNFTQVAGTGRTHLARLDAAGTLDTAFNANVNGEVYALALQPDGRLIFGGNFSSVQGFTRNNLARIEAAGALDESFSPNPNNRVHALLVQRDGTILVGGEFTRIGASLLNRLAMLNANGTVITAVNANANGTVTCLAPDAYDSVWVGGSFTAIGGASRNRLALLNFGTALEINPNVLDGEVRSLVVQADGSLLVAGSFTGLGGNQRPGLARLTAAGAQDFTFNAAANGAVNALALQADGKVLLGGAFTQVNSTARNAFGRLLNGSASQALSVPDRSQVRWVRGGSSPDPVTVTFERSADGGTNWTSLGNGTRLDQTTWQLAGQTLTEGVLRARGRTAGGYRSGSGGLVEATVSYAFPSLTNVSPASGTPAGGTPVTLTGTNFTGATSVTFGGAAATAVTVVNATTITCTTPAHPAGAVSVLVTTPVATTLPNSLYTYAAPTVTASTANLKVTTYTLVIQGANFSPTPALNTVAFSPSGSGTVTAATASSLTVTGLTGHQLGTLRAVVTTSGIGSGAPVQVATVVGPDPGDADPTVTEFSSRVRGMAPLLDGKTLVVGDFTRVNGEEQVGAARLLPDGTRDATFTGRVGGDTYCVAVQDTGHMIFGGNFSYIGIAGVYYLGRMMPNGDADYSFGYTVSAPVYALAIQPDGKILAGGRFPGRNGGEPAALARFFPTGGVDPSFDAQIGTNNNGTAIVYGIQVLPDGKILVAGDFGSVNGVPRNGLVRVDANGMLDASFNPGSTGGAYSINRQPDGNLLVGGIFPGTDRFVRLLPSGARDASFTPNPTSPGTVSIQADGRIIMGGTFSSVSGVPRNGIARLSAVGALDPLFVTNVTGGIFFPGVYAVMQQLDGKILVGGEFTQVNGQPHSRFVRLYNDPAVNVLSAPDASRVRLERSGSAPEIASVSFERSSDGGTTWIPLGPATRVGTSANWEVTGLALADAGLLRARGRTADGINSGRVQFNGTYNQIPPPVVTGISPATGATVGGTDVTISGQNFRFITAVTVGGQALSNLVVVNPTTITGTTAAHAAGAVHVGVVNPGGTNAANTLFTYVVRSPVVTASTQALPLSSTTLTVPGQYFSSVPGANTVVFSPSGSGTITASTTTSLTVSNVTGLVAGPISAVVTTNGLSSGAPVQFGQLSVAPTLTAVSPATGDREGYTLVTLTGTNFTPGTSVTFDGIDVQPIEYVDLNTMRCRTPEHAPGPVNVVVSNAGGSSAANNPLFTYITTPPTVTPSTRRLSSAATVLTIRGTYFSPSAAGNTVTFTPSGSGTVTWALPYQLTVTGLSGFAPGPVYAVVTSEGLSSGAPVQVATFGPPGLGEADGLDLELVAGGIGTSVIQPDGKIIVAGNFTSLLGQPRPGLARILPDGTLDPTFVPTLSPSSQLYSVSVQADGQILLSGQIFTASGSRFAARLSPTGVLDATFDPAPNNLVFSLLPLSDGRILMSGYFTTVGGVPRSKLARLEANGAVDPTYVPANVSGPAAVALLPFSDGRVLVGGSFASVGGTPRKNLAMLKADGQLDLTYGAQFDGTVASLIPLPDGKVLAAGQFLTEEGAPLPGLVRLLATGAVDPTFQPNGVGIAYTTVLQADGRILVGGLVGEEYRGDLVRFEANGALDPSFDADPSGQVNSLSLQADGKVLAAGSFLSIGGQFRRTFARLSNGPGSQALTVPDATQVLWTRSGTVQEVSRAWFEQSTDGGATWQLLGPGVRVPNTPNWQLTGLALNGSGQVRARGATSAGIYAISASLTESTATYNFGGGTTALENWRQLYFGTTANTGSAADTFDADGDGLPNLLEFAFGLNPTQANGVDGLPQVQKSGGNLFYSFTPPPGVTGVTYQAEWSTTPAGPWTEITDTGTAPEHRFSVPLGSDSKKFLRLRVTNP